MKKVKISKEYGTWFYEKEQDEDMEFAVYKFWNETGECYILGTYRAMIDCIKEPTKEARELFERIYG